MKKLNLFTYSGSKELDLRSELNRTFFGASDEIAKGQLVILRRMRRLASVLFPVKDSDLERCPCTKEGPENEPDRVYECPICSGEGYLFDDEIVTAYKSNRFEYQDTEKYMQQGKHTTSMSFFYVESAAAVSRYDKIIEPLTDLEGHLATPVVVRERHNVHMAERFRADNGRTEYWRLSCFTD